MSRKTMNRIAKSLGLMKIKARKDIPFEGYGQGK
jgi:hypothetical protein